MPTLNWIPWLNSFIASPELNFVTQHLIQLNSESNTLAIGVGQGNRLAYEMTGTWFGQQEYIYCLFLRCVLWRCLQLRSVTEHELGYVSNVTHKFSSFYVRAVRPYFVGNELFLCGSLFQGEMVLHKPLSLHRSPFRTIHASFSIARNVYQIHSFTFRPPLQNSWTNRFFIKVDMKCNIFESRLATTFSKPLLSKIPAQCPQTFFR